MTYNKDDKKLTSQQIINRVYNENWHFLNTADVWLQVSMGQIEGASFINKFGIKENVNTTEVAVWDWPNWYTFIDIASTLTIASDSGNDTVLWTWARTVYILWLDANYNEISETIELNGTSLVTTQNSYLRIYRMMVMTSWTNWTNVGNIHLSQWANVVWNITAWEWQTLMAIYTVPAWKTWYLTYGKMSTGKWFEIKIRMKARPFWWAFQVKHIAYCYEGTYDYEFTTPLAIPEKTDIIVTAEADLANANVTAVWDMILLDN